MTKKKAFSLLFVISLAALLVLLYGKTKGNDLAQHDHFMSRLDELKKTNNRLNESLIKVQAGETRHYDELTHYQRQLSNQFVRLNGKENRQHLSEDGAARHLMEDLARAIEGKDKEIEGMKQRHALLRNSFGYYPKILHEISSHRQVAALGEYIELGQWVMFFALSGEQNWYTQATSRVESLEENIKRQIDPNTPLFNLMTNFLAHSHLILNYQSELSRLASVKERHPVGELIHDLRTTHMTHWAKRVQQVEYYRQLMFGVLAALVALVGYVLLLLGRNALTLARVRRRAHVTLESIGNGVVVTDGKGHINFINPAAAQLIEVRKNEIIGQPVDEVFNMLDEIHRTPIDSSVKRCLQDGEQFTSEAHSILMTRKNREVLVAHRVSPIRQPDGPVDGVVMVIDDVTQARHLARKLEWQATHDALTGLVNRHEFENRLAESLVVAKQDRKTHALLYLDLDQFKVVNDTCGHAAGDALLKQLVDKLHSFIRSSDTFARLGGDEFGLLMMFCRTSDAEQMAESLLQAIQQFTFAWQGKTFHVGCSIGVVSISKECQGIAELLSAADVACYAAKDAGRNRVHVFRPSDQELKQRQHEMHWVNRVTNAINEDRLVLYGQKIVPIKSYLSGDTIGKESENFEVLVRMRGHDGSIIPPGAFLPAAERYNVMSGVDRWVIGNALRCFATPGCARVKPDKLSINISGGSLGERDFLGFIEKTLHETGVDPQRICFELTETEAVSNMKHAQGIIAELRGMGCKFALDDFGAGMSSFVYLKDLPVDFIKIEGKFVKDIVSDRVSRSMVEMIHHMAHVMNIETIAEFVEDEATLGVLAEIGVDHAQGYGIHQPSALCFHAAENGIEQGCQYRQTVSQITMKDGR